MSSATFNARLLICPILLALAFFIPSKTENVRATHSTIQIFTKGFCHSEQDKPVVYFSSIFDVNVTLRSVSTQPVVNAFKVHLVEEYDYKSNSNYPINCLLFKTVGEAEASKRKQEAQTQGPGKQIVAVDWRPPAWGQVLQGPDSLSMPLAPPMPTFTVCMTGDKSGSYFSGVFGTLGVMVNPAWSDAFNDFLRKNYSFPGADLSCTSLNTAREAERHRQQRMDGLRLRYKVIDTGWKFDQTSAANIKPRPKTTPRDDDPEPVQPVPTKPPPAASALKQVRDAAVQEMPVSVAYCKQEATLSLILNCDSFARVVYNYRVEHANEVGPNVQPEPVASLMAAQKLDCTSCIDNTRVAHWVTERATAQKLSTQITNCITMNLITTLYQKPTQVRQVNEFYNDVLDQCKK